MPFLPAAIGMPAAGPYPGLLWALALVAGLFYALRAARLAGLDPPVMYQGAVAALIGGIWGSHWLGLLVHGTASDPLAWLVIWKGGKSFYGGLLLGMLAGAAVVRLRGGLVLAYADAASPAAALGYGIGRFACLFNGDDFGVVSRMPWALVYPPDTEAQATHAAWGWIQPAGASLPVAPVQFYHALAGIAIFLALRRVQPRAGQRLATFALLYGASRFALEFLRGNFQPVVGPLSLPQVLSLGLIGLGAAVWPRGPGREPVVLPEG